MWTLLSGTQFDGSCHSRASTLLPRSCWRKVLTSYALGAPDICHDINHPSVDVVLKFTLFTSAAPDAGNYACAVILSSSRSRSSLSISFFHGLQTQWAFYAARTLLASHSFFLWVWVTVTRLFAASWLISRNRIPKFHIISSVRSFSDEFELQKSLTVAFSHPKVSIGTSASVRPSTRVSPYTLSTNGSPVTSNRLFSIV